MSLPLRTKIARAAGIGAASISRALGRGEGSVIGGRVTLAIDPQSLSRLAVGRNTALVSGTNGKTTTTSLLTAALKTLGPVSTNGAGANMFGGMVSALSSSDARSVVLETDEAHVPKALRDVNPSVVVLLNLSRDQLDRVGEVRMQALKWREALEGKPATVIANGDDPLVVWSAQTAAKIIWVRGGSGWRLDAASCPNCGHKIEWSEVDWKCSNCELRRPNIDVDVVDENVVIAGQSVNMDLVLPGVMNRHNAALALAAAVELGADVELAAEAMRKMPGVGGRFTSTDIGGQKVRLLLAKNPAGWTESLGITRNDDSPVVVAINARVQDGRDPSWLWDVPFEQLSNRYVVATGDRGRDLAVRLLYAGVDHDFEADSGKAVARASAKTDVTTEIDVIGNYSAFQDFRKLAK